MRTTVLLAALAACVCAAGAVSAADVRASGQLHLGAYRWQGPYAGVNLGHQWGSVSRSANEPAGIAGGLQGGYNWQTGQFVYGVETDLELSAADDVFAPWKFSNPWFGTLRGRGGMAFDNALLYGTVGLAYGTLKAQSTLSAVSESKSGVGWSAGFGLEFGLTSNWTARAEYLYVDLGSHGYALTGLRHGIDASLLRFGVNYRF